MTGESGSHQSHPASDADLVRSMALSSAELWHEILDRLRQVQESQARLAEAIEGLGLMVQDALGSEGPGKLGARNRGATLEPAAQHAPLPPVPALPPQDAVQVMSVPAPAPGTEFDLGFKTSAAPADSFITSVETSAPRAWSGATEVQEQLDATEVPEPVFYVPPFDEEVLPATAVAELTASALDDALASEFGPSRAVGSTIATSATPGATTQPEALVIPADSETPGTQLAIPENTAPRPDPARAIPTIDPNKVLDILLGTPRSITETASRPDALAPAAAPFADATPSPAAIPPPASPVAIAPHPPPPPPLPPVFTDEAPAASPVFTAEPDAPGTPDFATEQPPPPQPPPPLFSSHAPPASSVFTTETDAPTTTVFATEQAPPPSSVFVVQDPPQPTASPLAMAPPPPPAPPAPATTGEPAVFSSGEPPAPHLAVPPPRPAHAVFADTPLVNGSDPVTETADGVDEVVDEDGASRPFASTASMATEILAASPEIPIVAVPEAQTSELISKDVTLIARERKKRFRLH